MATIIVNNHYINLSLHISLKNLKAKTQSMNVVVTLIDIIIKCSCYRESRYEYNVALWDCFAKMIYTVLTKKNRSEQHHCYKNMLAKTHT